MKLQFRYFYKYFVSWKCHPLRKMQNKTIMLQINDAAVHAKLLICDTTKKTYGFFLKKVLVTD